MVQSEERSDGVSTDGETGMRERDLRGRAEQDRVRETDV